MNREFDAGNTSLPPGLSVIEASAGTGKTYTITRLVPQLLLEGKADRLSEILLVTYTTDAAGELADRVRKVLEALQAPPPVDEEHKDPGLHALRRRFSPDAIAAAVNQALLDIDGLNVSTIHSFCQRVLQDEGALCGLAVMPEVLTDRRELTHEVLHDIWEEQVAGDPVMAALADAKVLSLKDDGHLADLAAGLEDFEARPSLPGLAAALDSLAACRRGFTEEARRELQGFVAAVPENAWSAAAPPPDKRAEHIAGLDPSSPLATWIAAVRWVELLVRRGGGALKANTKDGKLLIAAAQNLAVHPPAMEAASLLAVIPPAWQIHGLRAVAAGVKDRLEEQRQLTYDGLIRRVRSALLHSPQRAILRRRLRQRFRIALVDESQDTDPDQFAIFRTIFLGADDDPAGENHRLVLVGDPKQAIYAFRGADLNTYLEARASARQENLSTLNRTFRAPPPLVRGVNAFFLRPGAFHNPGITFRPAESGLLDNDRFLDDGKDSPHHRVEVWLSPDDEAPSYSSESKRLLKISAEVASEITRLLTAGAGLVSQSEGRTTREPVQPGDFAVLVARHKEAQAVKEALTARGVPCVAAGGLDVMATEEAAELHCILAALEAPRRQNMRFAALSTRLLGRNDAALDTLAATAGGDAMLAEFTAWQSTMNRHGIAAALAEMDRDEGISTRLATLAGGERRIANLRQLTDVIQSAFIEHGNRPARLLRWLGAEIARAGRDSKAAVEERQQQLERDARAVRIVTMHAAKGMEYPLVFCPFLGAPADDAQRGWRVQALPRRILPLLVHTDTADAETLAALRVAAFEDRLRLAYVAMTRAKVKLWIYAGATDGRKQPSVLDWLLRGEEEDLPAEVTERGRRHAAGLDALLHSSGSGDVISVQPPPAPDGRRWQPSPTETTAAPRALDSPPVPAVWTMTSFSQLTREKNPKGDEGTVAADTPEPATTETAAGNLFLAAPGGAAMGTAIHDWMEQWDFSAPDAELLHRHLASYPLPEASGDPPLHTRVAGMLRDLRLTRLPLLGCTVAEACPDAAGSEWHFQLPVGRGLSPRVLAEVFKRHGHSDYAPLLAALDQDEVPGYLHGFIDRLAFHDGRWGVIDWKTNRLGDTAAAHRDPASLLACAMRSHYLLQMHLYLVALRRYLGPDTPPPAAWLVFLRGVRADSPDGVLEIQPAAALLDDLDGLFQRPA